jgi:lipopolysaccharide/colanic/teichoic acid biosynthesis glycosyltransferase
MNASLARTPVLVSEKAGAPRLAPAPAPHVYNRTWRGVVVVGDLAASALAFAVAVAVVWRIAGARPSLGACVVAAMLLLVGFAAHELHEKSYAILRRDEFYYALAVTLLCAVAIVPGFFITDMSLASRCTVALGVVLSGLTIGTMRYVLRHAVGERLFVEPNVRVAGAPDGDAEAWLTELCREGTPTHVVIAASSSGTRVNELARAAARRGIVLAIAAESCAPALAVRGLVLDGATLLEVDVPRVGSSWARRAKRLFDVIVASVALAMSAPILLLAALAIRLEDGGPALYTQQRIGRDGKTFAILKLRSMRVDAEAANGPVWAIDADRRVTRVGRFLRRTSIDELPQLVNVLRGEMSIVGPRPERPSFVEAFSTELPQYRERFIVAPGLTACSHLYMSRSVDSNAAGERLAYDLFYIRHWSLAMDVALLLKTAAEVVFHRAA